MAQIKLGLNNLTPRGLVNKALDLEFKMTGNANFPTPTPAIADITAKREELVTLIAQAEFGPSETKAARDVCAGELDGMLRLLAKYVSFTANGDKGMIQSSGFAVRKTPEPTPPLGRPLALVADRSNTSGEVNLSWKPTTGSRMYAVELTTTDPALPNTEWQPVASTTRSKHTVPNLVPGQYYWFRVRALGSGENRSPFSDVALVMAA